MKKSINLVSTAPIWHPGFIAPDDIIGFRASLELKDRVFMKLADPKLRAALNPVFTQIRSDANP